MEGVFGLKEGGPGWAAVGTWRVQDLMWMGEQERRGARKSGAGGCGPLETEYVIFLKKDPSG